MSEEVTNREANAPADPPEEPSGSPVEGTAEPVEAEAEPSVTPESPEIDAEAVRTLAAGMKEANITDPRAFMADYTRKSQLAAERERELSDARRREGEYRDAIGKLTGHIERQADPVESKRQAWLAAQETYDPAAQAAALDEYIGAREATVAEQAARLAIRTVDARNNLAEARRFGDFTPEQLKDTYDSITPADVAAVRAMREGKLVDIIGADKARKEQEAARAASMNEFFGGASPGTGPGGVAQRTAGPVTDWVIWSQWNAEARKEFAEEGGRVHSVPRDATIPDDMRI